MMNVVLAVTAVIFSLAAAGAIIRIARGPSLLDRTPYIQSVLGPDVPVPATPAVGGMR